MLLVGAARDGDIEVQGRHLRQHTDDVGVVGHHRGEAEADAQFRLDCRNLPHDAVSHHYETLRADVQAHVCFHPRGQLLVVGANQGVSRKVRHSLRTSEALQISPVGEQAHGHLAHRPDDQVLGPGRGERHGHVRRAPEQRRHPAVDRQGESHAWVSAPDLSEDRHQHLQAESFTADHLDQPAHLVPGAAGRPVECADRAFHLLRDRPQFQGRRRGDEALGVTKKQGDAQAGFQCLHVPSHSGRRHAKRARRRREAVSAQHGEKYAMIFPVHYAPSIQSDPPAAGRAKPDIGSHPGKTRIDRSQKTPSPGRRRCPTGRPRPRPPLRPSGPVRVRSTHP